MVEKLSPHFFLPFNRNLRNKQTPQNNAVILYGNYFIKDFEKSKKITFRLRIYEALSHAFKEAIKIQSLVKFSHAHGV